MWYGLTHLFHSLVSQVHIRHMCGATPSPMVCFRMVIYIWLHNKLTTAVELISSNGLLLAHLLEAAHVCDDDVAAFLLVPHTRGRKVHRCGTSCAWRGLLLCGGLGIPWRRRSGKPLSSPGEELYVSRSAAYVWNVQPSSVGQPGRRCFPAPVC